MISKLEVKAQIQDASTKVRIDTVALIDELDRLSIKAEGADLPANADRLRTFANAVDRALDKFNE